MGPLHGIIFGVLLQYFTLHQTSLGIHQQEEGGGSGVGGPTANIRGLCKGDGIQGREEVAQEVVTIDGCGKTSKD